MATRKEIWKTTRWSLVRRAAHRVDVDAANQALTELVHAYRDAIHACLRRRLRGHPRVEDAENGFFGWLLERNVLSKLNEDRKFRAGMQRAIDYYVLEWRRTDKIMSRDSTEIPEPEEPEWRDDPEDERDWASALLERALERLAGSSERGMELLEKRYGLRGRSELSPKELEAATGSNANAINQSVDRARRRLRELLLEELEDMTASKADFEEERDWLVQRLLESHPALRRSEFFA